MDFGHFRENYFSTMFWARRRKAVRQVFDPEVFITELSCHQLGAKLKLFILTFRPKSTYQHQKIKFSCRCGERVRLKMTLPAVVAENKNALPAEKSLQNGWKICFPIMSQIHFPGLGTLRLAIWTTYFPSFPICFGYFFSIFWPIFEQFLPISP